MLEYATDLISQVELLAAEPVKTRLPKQRSKNNQNRIALEFQS